MLTALFAPTGNEPSVDRPGNQINHLSFTRRSINKCAGVITVTTVQILLRPRDKNHIKLIIIDLDRAGDSGCRPQNRGNLVGLRGVIANSRSSSRNEFLCGRRTSPQETRFFQRTERVEYNKIQ